MEEDKLYEFTVTMCGWGNTPEEAWENCKDQYDIDKEELPNNEILES